MLTNKPLMTLKAPDHQRTNVWNRNDLKRSNGRLVSGNVSPRSTVELFLCR